MLTRGKNNFTVIFIDTFWPVFFCAHDTGYLTQHSYTVSATPRVHCWKMEYVLWQLHFLLLTTHLIVILTNTATNNSFVTQFPRIMWYGKKKKIPPGLGTWNAATFLACRREWRRAGRAWTPDPCCPQRRGRGCPRSQPGRRSTASARPPGTSRSANRTRQCAARSACLSGLNIRLFIGISAFFSDVGDPLHFGADPNPTHFFLVTYPHYLQA